MPRQGQHVLGVVVPVEIRNLQLKLEDGGFERHDEVAV
jgi:hypothetical protein